jgi:hypothetical protein
VQEKQLPDRKVRGRCRRDSYQIDRYEARAGETATRKTGTKQMQERQLPDRLVTSDKNTLDRLDTDITYTVHCTLYRLNNEHSRLDR